MLCSSEKTKHAENVFLDVRFKTFNNSFSSPVLVFTHTDQTLDPFLSICDGYLFLNII